MLGRDKSTKSAWSFIFIIIEAIFFYAKHSKPEEAILQIVYDVRFLKPLPS